jgi:hypothetical protein
MSTKCAAPLLHKIIHPLLPKDFVAIGNAIDCIFELSNLTTNDWQPIFFRGALACWARLNLHLFLCKQDCVKLYIANMTVNCLCFYGSKILLSYILQI